MSKPTETTSRKPAPTAEQSLYVCAASAAGLTPAEICDTFPPHKDGLETVTPESLARFFPNELNVDMNVIAHLVMIRLLQKALRGDHRASAAAELALFEALTDLPKFSRRRGRTTLLP